MRKIQIFKWVAKTPDNQDTEENTLSILKFLISSARPENMPRGLEKFKLFSRISKAFDAAEKDGILWLEEQEYLLLRKFMETDIPGVFGMNENMAMAVEAFMGAKEE